MTERQNGESTSSEKNQKFTVNELDINFGYNQRQLNRKTDNLVKLAEQARGIDENLQFIKDNYMVVSDERIGKTVSDMIRVDQEMDGIITGQVSKKDNISSKEAKSNSEEEKTFWEKFQGKFIGSRIGKRVTSLIMAATTVFQLGSVLPANAETPAPADPYVSSSNEVDEGVDGDGMPDYTAAPANPMETDEGYISDAYDIFKEEVSLNREFLQENECLPENLDCCARAIYAIQNSTNGFRGSNFDWPEKTILGNYLTVEQVVEFGKTGKCETQEGVIIDGIRDNNGKLIFFYVGASDYNVGTDTIETAILAWDPNRQDFLEYIENNDVCVFFQNKANKSTGTVTKFGFGILYFNYGKADKKAEGKGETYTNSVEKILVAESIANRLRTIEGNDLEYVTDSPLLKMELAIDLTSFLVKEKGGKFYKSMLKQYKSILEDYKDRYPATGDIDTLASELKDGNLVPQFVADSWEEIDNVIGK